jgi:hypothetical protein
MLYTLEIGMRSKYTVYFAAKLRKNHLVKLKTKEVKAEE